MQSNKQTIGFFGLGNMGVPMALNLLRAGYTVVSYPYSTRSDGHKVIAREGAVIVASAEAVATRADVIISIVPADDNVRAIYLSPSMRDCIRDGAVIIEMSSCAASTMREVADYYAKRPVGVIDAPVTGAVVGAQKGALTIMGAGDAADFERVQGIFDILAKRVYNLGPVGSGKMVKAMTNLLGAINLAAVGEFYRMAAAEGLDMHQLAEVVGDSAGASAQFERNFMKMVEENFSPTFTLALLRKDMGLALDMARACDGLSMPLADCAYRLYQNATDFDAEDCSAIAKVDQIK
ncbi:MAG: NAD(P)-dependent oxidoreductase [Peptococcaceae bacterium]|nr:NAD(P)-dependent oxidoreductase [Peptococcaceae bacterium]